MICPECRFEFPAPKAPEKCPKCRRPWRLDTKVLVDAMFCEKCGRGYFNGCPDHPKTSSSP